MANNRIYLYHPPSNSALYLGSRLGEEYHGAPDDLPERLDKFYRHAYWTAPEQDMFIIAYEHDDSPPTLPSGVKLF